MEPCNAYVFGGNPLTAEEARLELLEELFDPGSHRILDRIGLRRGGRFLEVGAGHGSLVPFLLSRCGARGHVVATDIDLRWLERMQHPNLTTMRHHLLDDDLEPLGLFDLVHTRLLLHHLGTRAVEALERLAMLVGPGGQLVVEEPLWDNRYDHAHPDAAQLQADDDRFDEAAQTIGMDMHVTITFPRRLIELGFDDTGNEIVGAVRRGGDPFSRFLAASITASSDAIAYDQIYDGGEQAVAGALFDPTLFYVTWHTMTTWGTRPQA